MDDLTFSDPKSTITLLIGSSDPPIEMVVHQEAACAGSPVLRAAFCGNFMEGRTKTYRLAHVDEATARLLVQWLYAGKIVTIQLKEDWKYDPKDTEIMIAEHNSLVDLWVLADELQMPTLQDCAVTTLFQIQRKTRNRLNWSWQRVYRKTSESSKLRLYICHLCALQIRPTSYSYYKDFIPYEMLMDIAQTLSDGLFRNGKLDLKLSDYLVEEG
ncbi:uncharacterized protein LY89DRAFT_728897 [Mollisia scopiformis]|uniref:BTB domain-containing protein n=1 Tax=Mollisia scopiformis TaxID=149040 RepID=A0A194XRV7_MOLSC|nr:uncharacterized protein LY89DRAFT_728897 [Mollisia scopiformis]KUJ22784.1 hypothetical protein LY89DRAFT_728897 [Mollisia scopiformis]